MAVGLSCLALAAPAAAISGSSGDVDASAAQYLAPSSGSPTPASAPSQGSAPSDGQAVPLGEETPVNETAPEETAVLPATPVASDAEGLPFTGYVLIGVLSAGILALLLGLAIRRFTDWRVA